MSFRILGRLEVLGASGAVSPAAPRQRVVLAMLLLNANRVVPVDRLVDAVWDGSPPRTARSQIQICISALRGLLTGAGVPDAIRTQAPGYLLRVKDGELDLHEFDRLVAAGRAAVVDRRLRDAAETFEQALAIWHGTPLVGLDSGSLQAAAIRLSERRLAVAEERVDVLLALGQARELVDELMSLIAEHPLREKLRAQLMIALYRDGRQAEALDVYRQARRTFVEELGLEPGEALQNLEKAILAADAVLNLPVSAEPLTETTPEPFAPPHLLPSDIADFIGREAEIRDVEQALDRDADTSTSPRILAITGKGGTGKTTFAVHLAHRLSPRFPDGQLYVELGGGESRPRSPAEVLERFLRALGVPGSAVPEGLDERAEIFRDRLAGRRVLVVLDDAATERQVRPLLPGGRDTAVILTSRERLTSLPGMYGTEIGMLDPAHAIQLVEQVAGLERVHAEPAAVRTLVELCGGLPLALRIAAARLAARPHWTIADLVSRLADEHRRLDELFHGGVGVRPSIALAYDGLSEDGRRLFRRLGILDAPDVGKWVAYPLLDTDQNHAEDLLERLVDVRLVDVGRVGGGPVRYHFHDLVRVYAREQLVAHETAEDRLAALRRVMEAWLGLAREAHRREYGGDYTVLHGDAEGWPLPGRVVADQLDDPLGWYEVERAGLVAAVRQAADGGLHEICWDLAMAGVTLFEARTYLDDWRETHEAALAATRRGANLRGEAAMLYSLGSLSLYEGQFDDASAKLQRALRLFDQLGDVRGSGLAQRNLAFIDRVRGSVASALTRYDHALTALRAVGDAVGEAHVLSNLAQIKIEMQQYADADTLLHDALAIARAKRARRVEAQALNRLAESFAHRGDAARAREAYHSVVGIARVLGDLVGEAHALYGLGTVHLRAGEYPAAELLLGQAHRMATQSRHQLLSAQVLTALSDLCQATGRPDEAARYLTEARDGLRRMGAAEQTRARNVPGSPPAS